MKRRILSILLLAALVIGLLPQGIFSVSANDDDIVYPVEGGNIYFDKLLYDMGIGSVAYCDDTITKAVIPAQIDGVAVTTIGDYAFCGCSKLTSVTIPEGVTTLRDCAFRECENLTEINLPDSVSQVGDGVFWNTAIHNAPDRWIDDVLYLDNWVIEAKQTLSGDYAIRSGTVGLADGAFSRCGELTSVTIPGSVREISAYAFYLCGSLTEVTIGSGTAEIGESAFCDCGSLTSVVLPDSLTSIGDRAFYGCAGLTSIALPDGLTYLGDVAFSGCAGLTSINIPDSVTYVGGWALWGTGIYKADDRWIGGVLYLDHWLIDATAVTGEYSIQKGTTGIASGAFAHCADLTCVILPEGVKYICGGAFYGCTALTGVVLPDSVTDISYRAFFDCDALWTVYFMGDAPALEENAFKMLAEDGWTEVNIPGLTLYYIDGKAGWTSPTWNGYPTSTWMPAHYYADVPEKAWYHDALQYASQNGLMNGVGNGKFDPEGSMTRAMLVTVLWRYAGEPTGNKNSFTDVPDGLWYTDAVAWAAANGIVSGVGNGKFDPEGNITREQMATILFRYAQKNCIDTSKRGDLSGFPDKGDISPWAKDAIQWTVAEQIINGSDGKLLPLGNATRAQVAAILMRFIENIVENKLHAKSHTEVIDPAMPATCTEAGKTEGKHCSVCNTVLTAQETIPALGHDYGDWTQTKAPTCTEQGEEKHVCSRCDAYETRKIEAHGHAEVVDAAIPVTCTEAGKTEGKHCSVCNTVLVAQETIPALGHDYGDWTQTKAPTCTEQGEEKHVCSRCDAYETRKIEAHGHTEVVDAAIPATCTEKGKTEGKHCTVCGTVIVAQKTVAALGHDYGAWTQIKAPTCTEKGEEKRTCSRCNAFETREIAAHGHTEVIDAAVPATCTEKGKTKGKHCTVCGTVIVAQKTVAALGHDYGAWTQIKAPTCTEKGEEKRTCSRCNAFETREIAATGHTEVVDPAVAATCTQAGKTEGKHCSACNTVLVAQETVDALGHDFGEWTQTKEPTCTEQGEEQRVCSRCDAFETRALAVVDPKHVLTAGTRKLYIGMSLTLLLEYAGEPEEILSTTSGYTWYVYGTETYTDFVMAGVYENKVVAICASGADFSYRGCTAYGSVAEAEEGDTYHITILKDKNDNSAVYGILLTDNKFRVQYAATEAALTGESRVAFHMANAFRVLHEVSILEWCDNAATAARLHCEDMATNDYCAHTSLDGRQFYMRLKENGVLYRDCAENLCAGYYNGIGAHNAWVNSSGHRANLLSDDFNRCGVGFAYGADSYYRYYAVTDYYHTK